MSQAQLEATLRKAALLGDADALGRVIETGVNVDAACDQGVNALMNASSNDHTECVRMLLQAGANVHSVNSFQQNALMYAAHKNKHRSIRLLLEGGANVHTVDIFGNNVLMHIGRDCGDVLRALLDAGADVNGVNLSGYSVLGDAIWHRKSICTIRTMLEGGANVHYVTPEGESVLMTALRTPPVRNEDLMRILLLAGASVNHTDNSGQNAIHYVPRCCAEHATGYTTMLIQAGIDVLNRDENGRTMLQKIPRDMLPDRKKFQRLIAQLVAAGDRNWACVPVPCDGIEIAFVPTYKNAREELLELFRRLHPELQLVARATMRVLHRHLNEEALRIKIMNEVFLML